MRTQGYDASPKLSEAVEGFSWDVIVVKHMVPSPAGIKAFEAMLQNAADQLAGHNDGWGSYSET